MTKILLVSLSVVFLGPLTVANPTTEDENGQDKRAPKPKLCGASPSDWINTDMPFWKRCQPKEPCQCEENEKCLIVVNQGKYYCQGPNTNYPKEPCDDYSPSFDDDKPFWKKCEWKKGCQCEKGEKCVQYDNLDEWYCQGKNTTYATCDDYNTTFDENFPRRIECLWHTTCMCIEGDKCLQIAGSKKKYCQGPNTQWKPCDDEKRFLDENKPYWKRCTPGRDCVCTLSIKGDTCLRRKGTDEYYCQGPGTNKCALQTQMFEYNMFKNDGTERQCRTQEECECSSSQICLQVAAFPLIYRCKSNGVG